MTISSLTRKALWANSGNLCAICRVNLIRDKKSLTNIGEECHIIAKKIDGPRGTPRNIDENLIDEYENLILLCANHHKEIDRNVEFYTVEKLIKIKNKHESYIKDLYSNSKNLNFNIKVDKSAKLIKYMKKKGEFYRTYDEIEEFIEEYNELSFKEKETLFYIVKKYYKTKNLDIKKILKQTDDDLQVIESLKSFYFLEWEYTNDLIRPIDDSLEFYDLNKDIRTTVTIKDNWSLGNNGYILLELYSSFNESLNMEMFINKINSVLK